MWGRNHNAANLTIGILLVKVSMVPKGTIAWSLKLVGHMIEAFGIGYWALGKTDYSITEWSSFLEKSMPMHGRRIVENFIDDFNIGGIATLDSKHRTRRGIVNGDSQTVQFQNRLSLYHKARGIAVNKYHAKNILRKNYSEETFGEHISFKLQQIVRKNNDVILFLRCDDVCADSARTIGLR